MHYYKKKWNKRQTSQFVEVFRLDLKDAKS